MRDTIGRDFTTKQVKYGFRNICNEFMKRLDSDLPFYYHTSSHTRFQEGLLPEFDKPRTKEKRKGRNIPRREQKIISICTSSGNYACERQLVY